MENELIKIKNLKIKINDDAEELSRSLLEEIDFSLFENEIVGLIGENGVGKTVFAKLLASLFLNHKNIFATGEIIFNNQKLIYDNSQGFNEKKENCKDRNGIVFLMEIQKNSFNPILKIKNQFIFLLKNYFMLSSQGAKKKFHEFLFECNFLNVSERILNSYPNMLSLGEIQKLLLLMGLMLKPKILILDEPLTSIDENVKKEFRNEMLFLKNKFKFSCIIISHDFNFLKNISEKIFSFENKKISILKNHGDCINKFSHLKKNVSEKNFSVENKEEHPQKILIVKNLSGFFFNKFRGKKIIFKNISFKLHLKENLIITGMNGAGKSSFCEIIAGLSKNFLGDFSYFLESNEYAFHFGEIRNFKKIRKEIQMVFQDSLPVFDFRKNIYETLTEAALMASKEKKISNNNVKEIIDEFEITTEILKSYPQTISGGERQKILIVRSLIMKPKILILDEAFSQLSKKNTKKIINILKKFQKENEINYIFVSHDDYLNEEFNLKKLEL